MLDQRLQPGSRKRNAYSRLFLARWLLTLQSCQDLIDDLIEAVRNVHQWVASHHGALFAEPTGETCFVRIPQALTAFPEG